MRLSEYDDDDLLEEVKHRGFKIEVTCRLHEARSIEELFERKRVHELKIGGMTFDISN